MADFIYMVNPKQLKKFLNKIHDIGIPEKLTIKGLQGLGFKAKNDSRILVSLKNLGFLDQSGEPTQTWKLYRNKTKARTTLAKAIKEHYATLYKVYPNAHLKDNEALRNFFSSHTEIGARAQNYMVSTFKSLVELANFDEVATEAPQPATHRPPKGEKTGISTTPKHRSESELAVNINIQLTLPEGSTPETFEAFFKAMRKHLLD